MRTFPRRFYSLCLSWPFLWWIGLEQFAVSFFLFFEIIFLIKASPVIKIDRLVRWNVALFVIWMVSIPVVDNWGLYIKGWVTILTQIMFLIVINNQVKTKEDWLICFNGVSIIGAYLGIGAIIFISGAWDGEINTVIGRFIPDSLSTSYFFQSIKTHAFGAVDLEDVAMGKRVTSFALSYSSLSMAFLLTMPILYFKFKTETIIKSVFWYGCFVFSVIGLVFTESRVAIISGALGFVLFVCMRLWQAKGAFSKLNKVVVLTSLFFCLLVTVLLSNEIASVLEDKFSNVRSSSAVTRARIYEETIKLIPEHLFFGWGTSVPINNTEKLYAAGTHSSILGMLFQHGVFGLAVYMVIWYVVWKDILLWKGKKALGKQEKLAKIVFITAMFCFNVRELADIWWWDFTLCLILWGLWGLASIKLHEKTDIYSMSVR